MEILVCVKQVPDDSVNVGLDGEGKPAIGNITPVVNAFDTYALEMAARLKEAHGGSVTVLTLGESGAVTASLRSCLSVGADHAFVIEKAEESSQDRSRLLARGVKNLEGGPFDLIFCGCESTDTANSQLGVLLAEQLGLPVITNILGVEPRDGGIAAKQETEEGYRTVEAPLPCVVTVTKPDYSPRYPSIKSKLAARKMPIGTVEVPAEPAPESRGSVRRVALNTPPQRQGGRKIQEKDPAEAVRLAMEQLIERKLV